MVICCILLLLLSFMFAAVFALFAASALSFLFLPSPEASEASPAGLAILSFFCIYPGFPCCFLGSMIICCCLVLLLSFMFAVVFCCFSLVLLDLSCFCLPRRRAKRAPREVLSLVFSGFTLVSLAVPWVPSSFVYLNGTLAFPHSFSILFLAAPCLLLFSLVLPCASVS